MPKTITSALSTHIGLEETSLATIWRLTRTDGTEFFFTDHDVDIEFEGNVYEAAVGYNRTAVANQVGLNVDNLDVQGFLDSDGITEKELRAGLYDFAEIRISVVNWRSLSDGELRVRRGRLGEVIYSDKGRYQTELRGLTQAYSQEIVELYQPECRADLGDSRCKVSIVPDVMLPETAYEEGKNLRGSPQLDGKFRATLLVRANEDANDDSVNAAVATLGTQAAVQDVTVKFGAGSLEFSPSGSVDPSQAFASYPDIAAYAIGTGEFTFECWVNFKSTGSIQTLASHYLNTGNQRAWHLRWNNTVPGFEFLAYSDGSTLALTRTSASFTPTIGVWYHVAVSRDSAGDVRLFIDGTLSGTNVNYTGAIHDSTEVLRLGKRRASGFSDEPLDGFVDDARLVVGHAVYTANFTAPTAELQTLDEFIATLVAADFEDVYYEVTTAGTTGQVYPDFDPTPGNITSWGTAVLTAREAYTRAILVATVTDNRTFTVTFPNGEDSREVDDWFKFGAVSWESGNNADLAMEVKGYVASTNEVTLFLSMPFDVIVGDTGIMYAGCDKRLQTCISKFNNVVNFRGEPYVPGQDEFLSLPDARA